MSLRRKAARPLLFWTLLCAIPAIWLVTSAYSASGLELPLACNPDCSWTPDIAWTFGLAGLGVVGFLWVGVAGYIVLTVWIRSSNS